MSGKPSSWRMSGSAYWVFDPDYLVEGRWSPEVKNGFELGFGATRLAGRVGLDGSLAAGFDTGDHRWMRATFSAEVTAGGPEGVRLRTRLFAGAALAAEPGEGGGWDGKHVPRERMYFLAGGGPFASLSNPWVRSHGAPLADEGRVPGDGELRGFHPGVALPQLATFTAELPVGRLTVGSGTGWSLEPLLFAGVGVGGDLPSRDHPSALGAWSEPSSGVYAAAGAGIEIGRGNSPIRVKLDVPVWVTHPELSAMARKGETGLRWTLAVVGY